MSEIKHTPGPWKTHVMEDSIWIGQPKPDGRSLEIPITKIDNSISYKEVVREKNLADAKLIAAAPFMLEILQTIVTSIEDIPVPIRTAREEEMLKLAKTAILIATT